MAFLGQTDLEIDEKTGQIESFYHPKLQMVRSEERRSRNENKVELHP